MKKTLKISGIVLLVLILLIIVTPILFKGKIMKTAKEQLNSNLNAKVEFSDLKISLIRNFPNLTIALNNLSVAGVGTFEGDTLVKFDQFKVVVDLISAIKMENIEVKSILLDNADINAIVNQDSLANWDIVKADTAAIEEEEVTADTGQTNFNIALKKFEIISTDIRYSDMTSDIEASLEDFNFLLKGDLSSDYTTLSINSHTSTINVIMSGIKYLKNASLDITSNIEADLKNSKYTFKENEIALNELSLGFDGVVEMPENGDINTDVTFKTNKADFKTLLSLVPAIYMKDFETVKTSGKLQLEGAVKGTYNDKVTPNADIILIVENAMFSYPDLPKSVDNINIDMKAHYDGTVMDNTTVDLKKFHLEMAGNPVDIWMNVSTPISDMHLDGGMKGKIDLASLTEIVPLEGTTLKGVIDANVDMVGNMSMIENEKYEEFKADGAINITNLEYASADIPTALKISIGNFIFSPKFVEITALNAQLGKSDFQFIGKLENFIPYAFKDDVLKGNFKFSSSVLDLNELMASEETTATTETVEDTAAMTVVEIPANLDITLVSNLGKIYYDKLVVESATGTILVKDSKLDISNLKLNTLGGSIVLNGVYNTTDIKNPNVDLKITLNEVDIPSLFNTFNTIQKLAPVAKNLNGKVSASLDYNSLLGQDMMPILNSIAGAGSLTSKSLVITESKTMAKLASALNSDKLNITGQTIKDVAVSFIIKEGRVYVDPFDIKLGTTSLVVSGDQGLDQTLNYTLNMIVPKGNIASSSLNSLASSSGLDIGMSEDLNLQALVTGTFLDPIVKPLLKGTGTQTVKELKEQAVTVVKEEVKETVSAEAEKLMANAQKEADQIRAETKKQAEALKKEAYAAADKLVADTKNPLAKTAAEATAKKSKQEADKKYNAMILEGDKKAQAVLDKAQVEADKLK